MKRLYKFGVQTAVASKKFLKLLISVSERRDS